MLVAFAAVALAVTAANARVLAASEVGAAESAASVADCAVVLGAGVYPDQTPSPVLQDRLETALSLYREGRVRRLLVSGDHGRASYDETNTMRLWLEARGVPHRDVFMDHAGFDTYSSMWRAKHVFGAKKVIVVTQRFHLARSVYLARAMGMEAEGAAADRRWYRGMVWLEMREVASRTKAALDVVTQRRPRHTGPPISLDGDADATAG